MQSLWSTGSLCIANVPSAKARENIEDTNNREGSIVKLLSLDPVAAQVRGGLVFEFAAEYRPERKSVRCFPLHLPSQDRRHSQSQPISFLSTRLSRTWLQE
jgi:hypothetical protein